VLPDGRLRTGLRGQQLRLVRNDLRLLLRHVRASRALRPKVVLQFVLSGDHLRLSDNQLRLHVWLRRLLKLRRLLELFRWDGDGSVGCAAECGPGAARAQDGPAGAPSAGNASGSRAHFLLAVDDATVALG
jgi:hypothetical protein